MRKAISIPQEPGGTPFERFDRLFRKIIAVPKSAIDKEEAEWQRRKQKKRAAQKCT
jgi:hypothetical protein